jgi:hypothetical protein
MPTIEDLLTQIDFHFWKQRGRYSHSIAARLSENGFLLVRYDTSEPSFSLYAFTSGGKTMCIGSVDGGHHFLPTQAKFLQEIGSALIALEEARKFKCLEQELELLKFTNVHCTTR